MKFEPHMYTQQTISKYQVVVMP